jgi:hypothetical protein
MLEDRNLLSTFTVDHLADDALGSGLNGSLRYCVSHAADGDHIQFGVTGTINLTGNLPILTHSISIEGPGPNQLTVRSNIGGYYDVFVVGPFGGGATVAIAGLTIANGYEGIFNYYGNTLTLTNVSVGGNYTGIVNVGTLTVNNSTVSSNDYGGIGNDGTLTVNNSTVTGNGGGGTPTVWGGGIYNDGTLTVNNSTVSGNSWIVGYGGSARGGGIYNLGTFALINSTVSDNFVQQNYAGDPYDDFTADGGGICNRGGTVALTNSTISGNAAIGHFDYFYEVPARGGGIYNGKNDDGSPGTLTVSNCTISGNSAESDYYGASDFGGGIYNDQGTFGIANSTVSDNQAFSYGFSFSGGGIYNSDGGLLHARNTIVAGNHGFPGGPDVSGNLDSQGHNLIGNTYGGGGFDPTDLLNIDPLLGPLQNDGGPTKTMALLAGSPALNAGDPAQLGVADQRGVVRSGGVNIGAYQASATAFVLTAPATATAGTAFNLTVKVVDTLGQTAVGYTGTVHFNSSDSQAVLPSDYTFTSGDAGVHTFTSGVTLKTAGNQPVAATDTATAAITGSSTVAVTPAAADHLVFLQQPTDTAAGQTISPAVRVAIVDQFGNVENGDSTTTVTLSLGANPSGGTLSGTLTVTVVNGVATFSDLSIDLAGAGYTLHARVGGGLPDLDSNLFNVL